MSEKIIYPEIYNTDLSWHIMPDDIEYISVLQEQGFKVGLYTSPHLKDFRARIRINGEMISQKTWEY